MSNIFRRDSSWIWCWQWSFWPWRFFSFLKKTSMSRWRFL